LTATNEELANGGGEEDKIGKLVSMGMSVVVSAAEVSMAETSVDEAVSDVEISAAALVDESTEVVDDSGVAATELETS
jgi:hypothetical protein